MPETRSLRVAKAVGIDGCSIVNKFGKGTVGTSFVPVCTNTTYRMPQAASATTLRIKAGGNANDTAAGSGAREVTITGLDATGAEVSEAIATNGTLASSATSTAFMRLTRAWVSASGVYADATTASQAALITIEASGGGDDWAEIEAADYARSQSQIGCFSIPAGFNAYLLVNYIHVDSTQSADIVLMQRQSILDSAAPYQAMRLITEKIGVVGYAPDNRPVPLGPFPELTDIVAMAKTSAGTADVTIDMDIIMANQSETKGVV